MKEEWKKCVIGELCTRICSGGTPKSMIPSYYGGTIPWLNTKEINFNRIYNTENTITEEGLRNSSAKWVNPDSVIVAMYGATAGRCAIAKIPLTTNQACCNLEIQKEKADYRFVYYALCRDFVRLSSLANGGAQQNLNIQRIKEFDIPLPPIPIQQKIASILSSLDDKIELNNRIIRNLEAQAEALFSQTFHVSTEDFTDKPVYDFAEFINGSSFKKNEYTTLGIPIARITELKNGISSSTLFFQGNAEKKVNIDNGDILFSWSGNPETSIDIFIWGSGKALLNQHIFNVKSHYGSKWFTYLMLKYFKPDFTRIASNKQTTGLGHVTVSDLKRLTFPFNEAIIRDFEEKITPIMELVYYNILSNNRLAALRDALLPRLMSGEMGTPV